MSVKQKQKLLLPSVENSPCDKVDQSSRLVNPDLVPVAIGVSVDSRVQVLIDEYAELASTLVAATLEIANAGTQLDGETFVDYMGRSANATLGFLGWQYLHAEVSAPNEALLVIRLSLKEDYVAWAPSVAFH